MNAQLLGLFSGFPSRRFPETIAERLRAELPVRDRLVFISAWPDEFLRNDEDAAGMHGMFVEYGLAFDHFVVIDCRTKPTDAQQMIREANCVFLMGGNPTLQMRFIREKLIEETLRGYHGVLLGVSAGAINMARRSLDVWEAHVPYNGLGLTGVTIKSHVNPEEHALLQTLRKVSAEHSLPICAMEDESAVFICNGKADWIGHIRYIEDGEVKPFTQELLERLATAE